MTRVIVSMTSTSARNGTRHNTFDSLLAQTMRPDEYRIYIDPVVLGDSEIESYKQRFFDEIRVPFYSIPFSDRGPVTKLAALTDRRIEQTDIVVTVDDDIVYEPRWLETLVEAAEKHPEHACGFSGWNTAGFLRAHREKDAKGGSFVWPSVPGPCDVLEGWAGAAYRRRFFMFDPSGYPRVLSPLPMFRYVDDVWISWQLHMHGVPRAVVGHKMSHDRPNSLPGIHNRPDFEELNRDAVIVAFGAVGNSHTWK